MGKSKRWILKRQLATAYINIDRGLTQIADLESKFAPQHKEMALILRLACVGLMECLKLLMQFSVKAWGSIPDDWESWRNAPKSKRRMPEVGP